MRRSDRAQDRLFSLDVIDRCSHGVMALTTGDPVPYCLPLSFVRDGEVLYFHCARQGRKIDLLRRCPQVCVTFVGQDDPAFEDPHNYTTFFQSVIVTGTAAEVLDRSEQETALRLLCRKLLPQHMDSETFDQAISHSLDRTAVWRISMDEISGKAKKPKQA